MKIFIDSADVGAIETCFKTGLVDGVTTNPSLILKSGRQPEDVYSDLARMGLHDISMEVVGTGDEMVTEGRRLFDKYKDIATIKVPCTRGGLAACKILSSEGIRVNVTLIFNAAQAILSAKAGATYVSPFVGRLDDNSIAGLEVVRSIVDVYRAQGHFTTHVLAASIREVNRAVRCWYNGAQICTIPVKVFDQMYSHVLTDKGLDIFDRDWAEAQATIGKHGGDLDALDSIVGG